MRDAAGLGFKAEHFADAMSSPAARLWFEVHAENYMVAGGPRLAMLEDLRDRFPLSLHGVGLSLAGAEPVDEDHLAALKRLVDRYQPMLVSEHLAWSKFDGRCFPDLLPVPRTTEGLGRMADNVGRAQDALQRQMLIENPTHYLPFAQHQWSETEFLSELARRTGCGLLIDVNNVFVGAQNLDDDAAGWLDAIPADLVSEIHLAGHSIDPARTLLIDSHDESVSEEVWALYQRLIERIGPRPTLIERDGEVPTFSELMRERDRAQQILELEAAYV